MNYVGTVRQLKHLIGALAAAVLIVSALGSSAAAQITPAETENPRVGSFGMEGTIQSPPPTEGARITVPSNGQNFTSSPITVSGICPSGLLVEIVNNGVMVGSTLCESGSFSLQVSLFPGQNDLSARVIDDLGQLGPASNTVSVTYSVDGQFDLFGQFITLTSAYSRRGAEPGSSLTWPLQMSGGTGPYAVLVDWGDGTESELISQPVAGLFNIDHVYEKAGIYRVTIKATDVNGSSGFLQVIAVAIGAAEAKIANTNENPQQTVIRTEVVWLPALVVLALLFPTFWLGQRNQTRTMRKQLERDAEMVRHLEQ